MLYDADKNNIILSTPLPSRYNQASYLAIFQYTMSYRDVGELLAERGIEVSYETVRR